MQNPYILKSSNVVYQNPWIKVREDLVVRPSGKDGKFGVIDMKGGATTLALDKNFNALLINEFKYAVNRASLELVSGGMEDAETPLEAAKRELLEEGGGETQTWIDLGRLDPFSSLVNSPNYMFLALNVEFPDKFESLIDEPLELTVVPFTRVVEMVMNSEITHGASCATVLKSVIYLQRNGQFSKFL